jgi:uncharacterized protein (TIGR02145 family)
MKSIVRMVMLSAVMSVCLIGCGGGDDGNPANNNGGVSGEPLVYGGQTYRTVKIDGLTWLAENLNYKTGNSWCYGDSNSYCNRCGRLYDWETAKRACPSGWHLPTRDEWGALAKAAGGTGDYGAGGTAGKALKSTSGWRVYGGITATDEFGFSALAGGFRNSRGMFYHVGVYGVWWTATEYGSSYAYRRYMSYTHDDAGEDDYDTGHGFSVRCVKTD